MRHRHIEVHTTSSAPPEAVWALLSDATTWPDWTDVDEAFIERTDAEGGQGVGTRRRFRRRRTRTVEDIVAFDPPRHVGYVLVSGLPVRDYRGDVTLHPTASGGTDIHWQSRFVPTIPGTGGLVARGIHDFLQGLADDLAAAAARA